MNKKKTTSLLSTLIFCLALTIIASLIIFNKQRIIDQITVWQYSASPEIVNFVDKAGMNENGKFYYFASQPKLYSSFESKDFNDICSRVEVMTVILGCYSDSRIHIYNVTDPQLDGIREVTAVHETMHAIYARLSEDEKNKVDLLLENEYSKLKDDKDFNEIIEFYARTEPGQRDNELHSIICTQVASIDPKLEEYYSKYFTDRQKVVSLDSKYSSVFRKLKKRANELEKQMTELLSSIETRKNQYDIDNQLLSKDIDIFNNKTNSGQLTVEQYNYERSLLQARVAELEKMRGSINADIKLYDNLVIEHNQIASESNKLYKAIDSVTVTPTPSV